MAVPLRGQQHNLGRYPIGPQWRPTGLSQLRKMDLPETDVPNLNLAESLQNEDRPNGAQLHADHTKDQVQSDGLFSR